MTDRSPFTSLVEEWRRQAAGWNNVPPHDHRAAHLIRRCADDLDAALAAPPAPCPRCLITEGEMCPTCEGHGFVQYDPNRAASPASVVRPVDPERESVGDGEWAPRVRSSRSSS